MSTTSYGQPRPRLRVAIDQEQLEYLRRRAERCLRHDQALFGGVSVGYSHRGEERDPIEIAIGLPKTRSELERAPGLHAGAGQHAARQQGGGRAGRGRAGRAGTRLAGPVPPRRALRRHGDGGTRRRASRRRSTACSRSTGASPQHDWGNLPKPEISLRGQPTDESQADAAVGRRVGDHLCHVPRHGRRVRRGDAGHLHAGRRAVPQLQAAAGDPDADPADADRHRARALAVRRAVHRHLDDRLHRAGRDHRAQLDPAGGFHPPRRRAPGRPLREVLMEAGAIRFKPILLTALSAMIGAATILTDPIFQGLAISLLFGLASSTAADGAGDPGDLCRAARRRPDPGLGEAGAVGILRPPNTVRRPVFHCHVRNARIAREIRVRPSMRWRVCPPLACHCKRIAGRGNAGISGPLPLSDAVPVPDRWEPDKEATCRRGELPHRSRPVDLVRRVAGQLPSGDSQPSSPIDPTPPGASTMLTDRYGLAVSTGSPAARDAYIEGVDLLLTVYPGANAAFDRAIAADPNFALAHIGKARALQLSGNLPAMRELACRRPSHWRGR